MWEGGWGEGEKGWGHGGVRTGSAEGVGMRRGGDGAGVRRGGDGVGVRRGGDGMGVRRGRGDGVSVRRDGSQPDNWKLAGNQESCGICLQATIATAGPLQYTMVPFVKRAAGAN